METVINVQEAPNNNASKPGAGGGNNHNANNSNSNQNNQALGWLKINLDYFRTLPGKLKIFEVICGIICMGLASPAYTSGTHWFLFVITVSFIGTLIWVFVYLLSIREALKLPIDWTLSELANTGLFTVLYAIAFIVQLAVWAGAYHSKKTVNIIAGVFAIFNTLAYGYATHLLHKDWQSTKTST